MNRLFQPGTSATLLSQSNLFVLLILVLVTGCGDENPIQPDNTDDEEVEPEAQFEQYGEPFKGVPDNEDVAMYEVNPLVFSSSKDLIGITKNLEQIKALGINTVWLMPIHPVGKEKAVGSPYAVRDYMSVKPNYGTLKEMRDLVEKAHLLNMAVIMDWVANHTAWDHDWIENKPEYYVTDEDGNIIHPPGTNFTDVAELNYNSQAMRVEMIDAMKFWVLEANIDGFRCDFASAVPADFWTEAITELRNIPERKLLMFAESDDKKLLDSGFDMIFGWPYHGTLLEVFNGNGSATDLDEDHLQEFAGLEDNEEVVRWVTNHDQHAWDGSPIETMGGERNAVAAFVAATYTGGVPLIYNGQEVGITTTIPFFEGSEFTIDWETGSSTREEYSSILNYRAETEALRSGDYKSLSSDQKVAVFMRYTQTDTVFTFINTEGSEQHILLPKELKNSRLTNVINSEQIVLEKELRIEPHQYLILNRD